jgi:hypothetical protein
MVARLDPDAVAERLQLVTTKEWIGRVDNWQAAQRPMLNRSEAIRQLVERGLKRSRTKVEPPS